MIEASKPGMAIPSIWQIEMSIIIIYPRILNNKEPLHAFQLTQ
jgi:hypothetical protein